MKFKSFLRKLFLGNEVLEKTYSSVNGEILVVENLFGKRELWIDGVAQSGGLAERLWEKISNSKFLIPNEFQNSNSQCLILGLGCGTLAKIISTKFPKSRIIGVEIDPLLVEIGKKYFSLGEIPNLRIVVGDAIEVVRSEELEAGCGSRSGSGKWDLIIVDLYVGQEFPKEAESDSFLNGLKKILAKGGLVIFNRLDFNRKHQLAAAQFRQKLIHHFPHLKSRKIAYNLLIFASL